MRQLADIGVNALQVLSDESGAVKEGIPSWRRWRRLAQHWGQLLAAEKGDV